MYGDEALKLVRGSRGDRLAQYEPDVVAEVKRECARLAQDMARALAERRDELVRGRDTPAGRGWVAKLYMDRLALLRNKRCLLAYHAARLSKLRDVCWDLGSGGVGGDPPPATASLLSQDELDFHSRYAELVLAYSEAVGGDAIGLTTQTLQPPKDVFIAVRVVRDVGTIVTESGGELDLRQGSQAWVMRRDVEHLILQGDLVQVRRPNVGSF